ncbi:MAG: asparaginase [Deferribacteres bacterium]|nr:asparaginase [candidate division KSB1 bacterium]MCB9504267.1 asparaginase [Deferribacteres bacterium]
MNAQSAVKLAHVIRGAHVESEHWGHIVVADAEGNIHHAWGNPEQIVHMRSAAKPFQVLPALQDDLASHFQLTREELALACASHNGESRHTEIAASILHKIGLHQDNLQCGVHRPLGVDLGVVPEQEKYTVLQNNCSGKHAVMLAACQKNGWPVENYLEPAHPHQKRILGTLAEMGRIEKKKIGINIDGCSAPEFSLPLKNVATMYANLASGMDSPIDPFKLMAEHPFLIAGTKRFDTAIISAMAGKVVAKIGAEGLECFAVRGEKPLGIVISIVDGNSRATPPVALALLQKLGILNEQHLAKLQAYREPEIHNHRHVLIGRIESVME